MARTRTTTTTTTTTTAPAVKLASMTDGLRVAKRILSAQRAIDEQTDKAGERALAVVLALLREPAAAGKRETAWQALASAHGRLPRLTAGNNGLVDAAVSEAKRLIEAAHKLAVEARAAAI